MKPLLITTEFRGVFFGYVDENDDLSTAPEMLTLQNARNCIRWSGIKGVFALASTGPTSECRVGSKVPKLTAWKITSITEVTPEAAEKWELEPWN